MTNCSIRREEITKGNSTGDELIKKRLRRLREAVKRIAMLARILKAKIIVGKFSLKAKDRMEGDKDSRLRHRIHQWGVAEFVEMLKNQPIGVVEVSEAYTSPNNPFNGERVGGK